MKITWVIEDYDLILDYHSRKENIVADALSQKSLFVLKALNAWLTLVKDGVITKLRVKPLFLQKIRELQENDSKLKTKWKQVQNDVATSFIVGDDGMIYFRNRLYVLDNSELKRDILVEAHSSTYSIHPGSAKM